MLNPTDVTINTCTFRLKTAYAETFGCLKPEYGDLIAHVANRILTAIAQSDALYHNVEHTILVTLVGQEILRGKQLQEYSVSPEDWLHFIVALLCHDVGYIKGICYHDQINQHRYVTGIAGTMVQLQPGCTDASLTPYHVDRGKQFVQENFAGHPLIQIERIQTLIELTRFPVPADEMHQSTSDYPGLARAADLMGQLSDPRYLAKIPALFYEFEETGANKNLGYHCPADLRSGYPAFYRNVVYPLIQPAVQYLEETPSGQQIVANLYRNVLTVEQERSQLDRPNPGCTNSQASDSDTQSRYSNIASVEASIDLVALP